MTEDWLERARAYDAGQVVLQPPDQADIAWGITTYVGPKRYRPVASNQIDASGRASDLRVRTATGRTTTAACWRPAAPWLSAAWPAESTGFIRTLAIAAALGAAGVGDAFNGANTFPNMVYELLLGGVLTSVIVPLLVNAQVARQRPWRGYTQRLMSLATVALTIATLLAVAAAPLIARAFVTDPREAELTGMFATLLLPEIFFLAWPACSRHCLTSEHVFGPGAWAPVVNNVIAILTVGIFLTLPGPHTLLPSTMTNPQILVLGIGTTPGIAAQAAVLIPFVRRTGFSGNGDCAVPPRRRTA